MSIEILHRGTPRSERPWEGECHNCKTRIRCVEGDGEYFSDRDGQMLRLDCPVCDFTMHAYPIKGFGSVQPIDA